MVEKLIECDCGWTCRGSEDELVAACTAHAHQAHGINLTREQVLAVARPVDAGGDENPTPVT